MLSQLNRSLVKILGEGERIKNGQRNGERQCWTDPQRNHISGPFSRTELKLHVVGIDGKV